MAVTFTNGLPFFVVQDETLDDSGIVVTISRPATPLGIAATLDGTFARRFLDDLHGDGLGTFRIPEDDPDIDPNQAGDPSLIGPDQIVRMWVHGQPRFAWRIRDRDLVWDEAGNATWEISGPSIRDLLAYSILMQHPQALPEAGQARPFHAAAVDYDATLDPWGTAVEGPKANDPTYKQGAPEGWVDRDARWIWDRDPTSDVPVGFVHLLTVITVPTARNVTFDWTADDGGELWVGGAQIDAVREVFAWRTTRTIDLAMPAGTHPVYTRGENVKRPYGDSPAALLLAAYTSGTAVNQVHHVLISAGTDGGTWTLTFDDHTTPGLGRNINVDDLRGAIERLPSVGPGNVEVTGSGKTGADQNVTIHNDATDGTFQILVNGVATNNIDHDASFSTVKTRIEELGIVTVTVTGAGTDADPWDILVTDPTQTRITFDTNDAELAGGTSTVTTVTSGTPDDPWVLTFVRQLGYQPLPNVGVDGSLLTGTSPGVSAAPIVAGQAPDVLLRTDDTWQALGYPAVPPAETPGQIILQVLAEQDTFGSDQWTPTFTGPKDSAGQDWTVRCDQLFTVGDDLTRILQALVEYGVTVRANHDFTLDMFDPDTVADRDAVLDDTNLTAVQDRTTSTRINELLVRTRDGTRLVSDSVSVTIIGRRRASVDFSAVHDPESAAASAKILLQLLASDNRTSTYGLEPRDHHDGGDVPWLDFRPGETVIGPDGVRLIVPSLGAQDDPDDVNVVYTVELGAADLLWEQRHERWLQASARGTLRGQIVTKRE